MAASTSRSRQVPFLVGILLILAALPVGWFVFLREPPAPPPPPPTERVPVAPEPVKEKRVELELASVEGTVEVQRGGNGAWAAATKGMALGDKDAVRTRDGSYAVLVNGETFEVRMNPGTAVSVQELTTSVSRMMIDNGSATAVVRGGKRHSFELSAKDSDAKATTGDGTFTMSNNGAGTVRVDTSQGEVKLHGKEDKFVIVRKGQQSIVRKGQAPSDPTPVPTSILLKVSFPTKPQNKRELVITGQTDPGNQVEVNGVMVSADEKGNFASPVALKEGDNNVQVRALGVGGLVGKDEAKVVVKTKGPVIKIPPPDWKTTGGASP
ncbi:hypothetical protein D7Y13_21735 [Corallococcus praedator]|uniref:FecR protein domain-containing protein n=1 Tax=Corallococcus praedator TaxID=2316724 RepID=A0ABX9QGN0_9BACT|nr:MULTISPECIES: FecR domain-containing protein [Corallococcus]RKH14137.1 hypothetical protein D7X74_20600 [Corallococcus sp. CA047B]RKH34636.1 hypothetical protein D7X75_07410 [Corallococcus sp. CA031C]RKI05773.1 hypothetical protein D7Y13_21735 [Corallococcus praedator]